MITQQLIWISLFAALALGQGSLVTNAPTDITQAPGYSNLSACAQCALRLPEQTPTTGSTCNDFPSIFENLQCNGAQDWNCACNNLQLAHISLQTNSFCNATDQQAINTVLSNFCATLLGNSTTMTSTPLQFTAQPTVEMPTEIAVPSQTTTTRGTLEAGGAGSNPTSTNTVVASASAKSSSLSTGAIVGIAVGGGVGLLAIIAIGWLVFMRRKPVALKKDMVVMEQEEPMKVEKSIVEPVAVEPFNPYPGPNDIQS